MYVTLTAMLCNVKLINVIRNAIDGRLQMTDQDMQFAELAMECNDRAQEIVTGNSYGSVPYDQRGEWLQETKNQLLEAGIDGCDNQEILDYLTDINWHTLVLAIEDMNEGRY